MEFKYFDESLREFLFKVKGKIVVLTGAGVSAESNIPTFRDDDGFWKTNKEEDLHIETFNKDPKRTWKTYLEMRKAFLEAQPNPAHNTIAMLEELGYISAVITQNIDGLHQKAGTKKFIGIHGDHKRMVCPKCGTRKEIPEEINIEELPQCCKRPMKPNVILFGQAVPDQGFEIARDLVYNSDLLLIIGASMAVYPVATLPTFARNILRIEPNPEKYPLHHSVARTLKGDAVDVMMEMARFIVRKEEGID